MCWRVLSLKDSDRWVHTAGEVVSADRLGAVVSGVGPVNRFIILNRMAQLLCFRSAFFAH